MHESFFMTSWVVSCLNGFKLKGWDLDLILAQAQLDQKAFADPCCRADVVARTFEAAAALYESPMVGIEARKGITPNSFLSISLAALASPNLKAALGQIIQFRKSLTNCVEFFLKEQKQRGVFGFTVAKNHDDGGFPLVFDAILSTTMKTCRFIQPDKPAVMLVEMGCQAPAAEVADRYSHYFKAPVVWNARRYAIHFDRDYLSRPSMHYNQLIMEENQRQARSYVSSLSHRSFADQVAAYLFESNGCEMGLADAAEFFSTGTRTLQRRLAAEGTSFCSLLEEVRKAKARHLLESKDVSVTEVAMELGFSDSANFCRAFKRWYGCSPSQYQKLQTHSVQDAHVDWLCKAG